MSVTLPRVTYSNTGADFTAVFARLSRCLASPSASSFHPNLVGASKDADGHGYDVRSPIDGRSLGTFVDASRAAVDRAVGVARSSFRGWAALAWGERIAILRKVADSFEQSKFEVAADCILEVGKSFAEAMGEVEESIDLIRYYCDEAETNGGYERPLRRAVSSEETSDVLRPYGVFAVIVPFNFPVALGAGMLAGALLAGNSIVLKPSPNAGRTGLWLARLFRQGGVPAEVLNLVCGGDEVGKALVRHPDVAGFAFIGSHAAGMDILRTVAAGTYSRPVVIEMGGKNPSYVTESADLDVAAEGVMRSAFGLQGQKCSSGSKVYVSREIYSLFMDRLLDRAARIKIAPPLQPDVFMGPVISEAAGERFARACEEARRDGRILTGGKRLQGGAYDGGVYIQPTIVEGLGAAHRLNKDELFLPLLTVQRFDRLADAIADGNDIQYGLTAGIYTGDRSELEFFLDRAEAGALYANRASGATTGAWPGVQTFCGWKGSGVSGKGGLGPYYVPQFMREQSRTLMRSKTMQ